MCGIHDAKRLIQEAQTLEKSDRKRSRQKYLEAAEIFLLATATDKKNEKRLVELSQRCFDAAERLKDNTPGVLAAIAIPKDLEKQYAGHLHEHEHEHHHDETVSHDHDPSVVTFASIAGLDELKEEIRFKIIEPLRHPEVFEYFGRKVGGGILMYGPPGCGKSLIAEAAANEAGATFFNVKASDLKSKFVGETEKNIAELFEKARGAGPAIIFFDEFESLGGDRTGAPVHERSAVAELLTQMNGVGNKDQKILLLAATNEPWSVDSALRREGRFGTTIFIPPPDLAARRGILKLHLAKRPLDNNVDIDMLAHKTVDLSGADISGICETATSIPLREYFVTKKLRKVTHADMEAALAKCNSVLIPWFAKAKRQIETMHLEDSFRPLVDYAQRIDAAHGRMSVSMKKDGEDTISAA